MPVSPPYSFPTPTPLPASRGTGIARYSHLIASFVSNDLKTRYAGSSVGLFWTVGKPLLELLTYTFVFTILLRVQFRSDFDTVSNALYLFCGFVAWLAVSESVQRTGNIIRENGHLIKKVHFPPAILPIYACLSEAVNQVLRFLLLMAAFLAVGGSLSWTLLWVPVLMIFQLVFTVGLAMLVSCASVYFKDIVQVLPSALMIWMFVTPVFYPSDVYARQYAPILVLNPLSHLVGMYRLVMLDHLPPLPGQMVTFAVATVILALSGGMIFHRHSHHFVDLV